MRKTATYTLEDLLENEDFISYAHHPTKESRNHWLSLIRKGKVNQHDYELALDYIKKLSESNESLAEDEVRDMWLNVRIENKKHTYNRYRRLYLLVSTIAAVILIAGFFLSRQLIKTEEPTVMIAESCLKIEDVSKPDLTGDDIQVILSGNNSIAVKDNHSEIKHNDKGEAEINSQKIEEMTDQTTTEKPATYNQVIIPKGKFSSLILSDGTKIWLNAASRVVYPPVFEKTKREIYIEGEAYMEVSPDKDRPFTVKTKQLDINVLGTSFNISAYEEETSQTIVLISGSVTVKTKSEQQSVETILSPNQLFLLTGEKTQIRNVNVKNYISWKEGYYIYKSETLAHILNRLSNYYGITIEFDDMIGNMRYSGKMDMKEDIESVLGGLCYTAPIEYQQKNDIYYLSLMN